MNFRQIQGSIYFNAADNVTINQLRPFTSAQWLGKLPGKPRGSRKSRDELKVKIKTALDTIQGDVCAFCGLTLYETSPAQIEHIAPKGHHPEFMYTYNNLCLACVLCNGFEKKSTTDTVAVTNADYDLCTFSIVHPYKDIPEDHYQIVDYAGGGVTIHYITPEAQNSRDMFDLDGPSQIRARGKQFMHDSLGGDLATEVQLKVLLAKKFHGK
jgi:uncharacterized protein (TIGR02646 family)